MVPGPPGSPGADSVVPGPPGADSMVPGPPGADSTVPGPPGSDATVTTVAIAALDFSTLPTSNPGGGKLWLNGGVLQVGA